MIKNKKGIEISTSMLVILIIAAVVASALFLIFGKFIFFVGEGSCDIKNVQYLGELPYKLSSMSGPKGWNSREPFSFSVPCGDRAYFVNIDKLKSDPNALKSFDSEPLIKNELDSNTGNNFFVMNGPKIVSATKLEGLGIDYPYNLCFDTKSSRTVNIEMEGRGRDGVNVIPYCEQLECTQVPEILQPNEKKNLIYTICGGTETTCKDKCLEDDACYKGCAGVDQACYDTEKQNIENAEGNIEVRLRVSTCFPEKTKVEFLIKPKEGTAAKAVKIFETLPKRCVENLNTVLDKVEVGNSDKDVVINPDPMLVWSFDTVPKEERVAYHLNKFLNDDCRKELRAVAAVRQVVNTETKAVITPPTPAHPARFDPGNTHELQRAGFELVQKAFETVEPAPEDIVIVPAVTGDTEVHDDEVEINLENTEGIENLNTASEEISLPEGCKFRRNNPKRIICRKDRREFKLGVVDRSNRQKRLRSVDIRLERGEEETGTGGGVNTAPVWNRGNLPRITLDKISDSKTINMVNYVSDDKLEPSNLLFAVVSSQPANKVNCVIQDKTKLSCTRTNTGPVTITVSVSDNVNEAVIITGEIV